MSTPELDADFIAQALPAFISEAQEQLESLELLLLQLEDDAGNRELLDALFRCAHTIKGSAGLFGLDEVVAFTHHVETVLDLVRYGLLSLTADLGTLLLRCNDQIRSLIAAAQGRAEPADAAAQRQTLVQALQSAAQSAGASAAAPAAASIRRADTADAAPQRWRLALRFGPEVFRQGMDPLAILSYLRGLGSIECLVCDEARVPALGALDAETCHLGFQFELETAAGGDAIESAFQFVQDDCEISIEAQAPKDTLPAAAVHDAAPPAAIPTGPRAAAPAAEEQRFIRVQADRLDALINLLGELVIASAGASLLARQSRQGPLIEANDQIGQLVEDIRNGTLQLRMVPIGETFSRFRRVVRDTAAALGKDVALEIVGGDTELDKSVVERIADPLMHLVRNGLDHGLETPAERAAAGKPAQGRLTLSACHEAGSILIRIDDDGRGIQRQKLLQRAWDRGLVETGTVPPDDEILNLIFAPGFSTAEQVTNLSGRGVGMDVVRSNIEALRGNVQVFSEAGRGSRIEIRLPLTLAIIDGFLVGVGRSRFIFPLDAVVEVIESRTPLVALDEHGCGSVELRNQVLPVVSLHRLYEMGSPQPERASIVVLRSAGRRFGVLVDTLLGQHQTVIKPLARLFRSLHGMSGTSILGNGDVALIFDVHALCQMAAHPPRAGAAHPVLHPLEGQSA